VAGRYSRIIKVLLVEYPNQSSDAPRGCQTVRLEWEQSGEVSSAQLSRQCRDNLCIVEAGRTPVIGRVDVIGRVSVTCLAKLFGNGLAYRVAGLV
jgi:hypothetical protein